MKNKITLLGLVLAILVSIVPRLAADPIFDTFGSQPSFTFGGSGIPNNAVAASTTYVGTTGSVLFGLTATPRYDNPSFSNDGAGTFNAIAGADVAHGQPGYGLWNFDFQSVLLSGSLTGYSFNLWYGNQTLNLIPIGYGDSWNLGMGFLNANFDPNANATYEFGLDLVNASGRTVDTASIVVKVGDGGGTQSVPDGGSTLMFLGAAVAGLGFFSKQRGWNFMPQSSTA